MPQLPPVIVLGIEEISHGLTAVRELGEHGVPVHGIARWRTPALYSRWLTRGYIAPETDKALIGLLNSIAAVEGANFVIALSEPFVLLIRRAADAGELHGLRALVPQLDKLELVNNKTATYKIAQEIGIPLPRTWLPQSSAEAAAPPANLAYPCILKFPDPLRVAPLLNRHGLSMFKSKYCYNEEELRRVLLEHAPIGSFPLVQSFCPGIGLTHSFFMHGGKALLRFRHIRLLEWPPEGGIAAVCKNLPVDAGDALFAKSEALLRRIGWEGAALLEYRYDPDTGRAAFLEINGRFWSGLSLAYHAGAPFVWLTYAVLGLQQPVTLGPIKTSLECRSVDLEIRRLAVLLFRPGTVQNRELRFNRPREIARFLLAYLKPQTRYYLFSWRDPVPCLADNALKVGRALRQLPTWLAHAVGGKLWRRAL